MRQILLSPRVVRSARRRPRGDWAVAGERLSLDVRLTVGVLSLYVRAPSRVLFLSWVSWVGL